MEDRVSLLSRIDEARSRIGPFIRKTPLLHSRALSTEECNVYLKLESEQHTGSFKARGALNKIGRLAEHDAPRIITASSGNHALGVAYAMHVYQLTGTLMIPENCDPVKRQALELTGHQVITAGADCFQTETLARNMAAEQSLTYISPYNDFDVVAGQGTIGPELSCALPKIDHLFVTVGGGGLVSGVATFLKSRFPEIEVIGCQPELSPEMALSIRNNHYTTVPERDTLSDGSAGAFEEGAITYPLCKSLIDRFELISEAEIAAAVLGILRTERKLIEGAAGVAVAAFQKNRMRVSGNVVLLICGGNISEQKLRKVFSLGAGS